MRFICLLLMAIVLLSFTPCFLVQGSTTLKHGDAIYAVEFSPTDNSLVASGSYDNTVKLWNISDNTTVTFTGHTGKINSVAFSPDGETVASGSYDKTFKLWDVSDETLITTLTHVPLANGSESIVNSVAFSPDGTSLATAGYQSVKLWNVSDWTESTTLTHDDWVNQIVFSPNGERLAAIDGKEIKIWKLEGNTVEITLEADADWVSGIAFSPDSGTFAAGGAAGTITLWSVSDWSTLGRISANGSVSDLAFSPDGETLASAGNGVELWAFENGRKLTTFTGHSGWVMEVAFSKDMDTLVSGGLDDGMLRTESVSTLEFKQPDIVRLIYFLPSDRATQSDIDSKIDTLIKATQTFYADQMETHGFGEKTFEFEEDNNGNAVVHHITGNYTNAYYEANSKWKVWDEIRDAGFDPTQYICVAFMDLSSGILDGINCGTGGHWRHDGVGNDGGVVNLVASGNCFDGDFGVAIAVHEFGHAFGLAHDYRNHPDRSIDLVNEDDPMVTSACAAEWLDGHRNFTSNLTFYNEPTTIDMSSPTVSDSDVSITFTITDADGLHHVKFYDLIPEKDYAGASYNDLGVLDCTALDGSSTTATFTTSALTASDDAVAVRVMDALGNFVEKKFSINLITLATDVNGDGVVNIQDVVAVASNLGKPGTTIWDVNGDGVVDIKDLVLVANGLSNNQDAPSGRVAELEEPLTKANLQKWLREARQMNLKDPNFQRGLQVLEQLLAALDPEETTLLSNYPNPFNPETWIPYRLAEPTEVSISIYAINGHLVRMLALGHQPAGMYKSRSRAAYWDGRNELGESVASGVYFYMLTAGDFIATRKMLIRK